MITSLCNRNFLFILSSSFNQSFAVKSSICTSRGSNRQTLLAHRFIFSIISIKKSNYDMYNIISVTVFMTFSQSFSLNASLLLLFFALLCLVSLKLRIWLLLLQKVRIFVSTDADSLLESWRLSVSSSLSASQRWNVHW